MPIVTLTKTLPAGVNNEIHLGAYGGYGPRTFDIYASSSENKIAKRYTLAVSVPPFLPTSGSPWSPHRKIPPAHPKTLHSIWNRTAARSPSGCAKRRGLDPRRQGRDLLLFDHPGKLCLHPVPGLAQHRWSAGHLLLGYGPGPIGRASLHSERFPHCPAVEAEPLSAPTRMMRAAP